MDRTALGLHWDLEPDLIFLNHGSFGLAPRELVDWRCRVLREIERDPVTALVERVPLELASARTCLADLVGAQSEQLVFVPSTTYGLNQLMQRLDQMVDGLPAGSEILMLDHGYNATINLVRYAAERHGWRLRLVPVPIPLHDPAELVQALERVWTQQSRVLLIDHITSPSALVMPLEPLIALAHSRDAWVIVDGAHAPGSLALDLQHLQADAYVGNLHKWLCCPRGSAFLWVSDHWRDRLRPLVISHGANAPNSDSTSRFHLEHDWIGTADPTPWLAISEAMRLLGGLAGKNLDYLIQRNHRLAQACQEVLLDALDAQPVAPVSCQASMIAVRLPPTDVVNGLALQQQLLARGFQVPIIPSQPHRLGVDQFLRISCFAYNELCDIRKLASCLPALLADAAA